MERNTNTETTSKFARYRSRQRTKVDLILAAIESLQQDLRKLAAQRGDVDQSRGNEGKRNG